MDSLVIVDCQYDLLMDHWHAAEVMRRWHTLLIL